MRLDEGASSACRPDGYGACWHTSGGMRVAEGPPTCSYCRVALDALVVSDRQRGAMGDPAQEFEQHRMLFTLEVPEAPAQGPEQALQVPQHSVLPDSCMLHKGGRTMPVFRLTVTDTHCMKILEEVHHPNILRPETIIYGADNNHTILVQPFDGNLVDFFMELFADDHKDDLYTIEDVINFVQLVFRQVLDGMIHLMDIGLHHGDFSLENTYFYIKDGQPVVILANFREFLLPGWEDEKLPEDWASIGLALDKVIELIKEKSNFPIPDLRKLCEMEDLSSNVLKIRKIDPDRKKELSTRHCFFWSPEKRASVFTYNIPLLLQDDAFCLKVSKNLNHPSDFVWDDRSYYGLLGAMNDYQQKNFQTKYIGGSKEHYLKFICGSYSHERALKVRLYWGTVDRTLRECDPELCLNVIKIVRAYEADKKR